MGTASTLVIATLDYTSGRSALRERVFAQLVSLRNAKADEVRFYVDMLRNHVESLSEDLMVIEATAAFADAHAALDGTALSPAQLDSLQTYYARSSAAWPRRPIPNRS